MTFTPTTCGVWHVDHITSHDAAGIFVSIHAKRSWMQDSRCRCWLRSLPVDDDRAGGFGKGMRFYGSTEPLAIWEAANWLYRSWRTPEAEERRIGSQFV